LPIQFSDYEYLILGSIPNQQAQKFVTKLYSEPLLSIEIKNIASTFQEGIFNGIKRQSSQA